MSKTRICGANCHNATNPECRCWCNGLFHGKDAAPSRAHFKELLGTTKLPNTREKYNLLIQQLSLFHESTRKTHPHPL